MKFINNVEPRSEQFYFANSLHALDGVLKEFNEVVFVKIFQKQEETRPKHLR